MIKLINDDCLNALDKIPNNSIDVIITSPPYNKAGYEGFVRKSHNKDSWKRRNIDYQDNPYSDFMEDSKYQDWQIKILDKCYDLVKEDGSIFYNHKIRVAKHKASHPIEWLLKTKFIFRQQIVWNRKASPTVAPIRYIPNTELIFWLTKNQKQPNFLRNKNLKHKGEVWEISASKNEPHPASFPIELIDNILLNIPKNSLILDPFMGIGTTGLSCKKNNMNFIGIEIDKKYFNIAKTKIDIQQYNYCLDIK